MIFLKKYNRYICKQHTLRRIGIYIINDLSIEYTTAIFEENYFYRRIDNKITKICISNNLDMYYVNDKNTIIQERIYIGTYANTPICIYIDDSKNKKIRCINIIKIRKGRNEKYEYMFGKKINYSEHTITHLAKQKRCIIL